HLCGQALLGIRAGDEIRAGAATAATDALREDGDRGVALRRDVAGVIHQHLAAVAARTGGAADGDVHGRRLGLVVADIVIGAAAATADRLRQQAEAAVAVRDDVTGVQHVDPLADARRAAVAADAQVDGFAVVVGLAEHHVDAGIAAAAADG